MHTDHYANTRTPLIQPVLFAGFAASVAVWCAWFTTHIPWLKLDESISLPVVLLVWLGALAIATRYAAGERALKAGLGAGLVSALVGLLILGSKLVPEADASGTSSGVRPNAAITVLGFLLLGAVLGLVAGGIANIGVAPHPTLRNQPEPWLSRFTFVAAAAVAPLLFIGGLVTSTNSGMAVPDWPNTFGSNMFFYPIGPRTPPDRYLEHAHRLFGTLVGLSTLVALVWVFISGVRGWPRVIAVAAFVLVCGQGLLGGARVHFQTSLTADDAEAAARLGRRLAFLHGILAQLVFGLIVALGAYLRPQWRQHPAPGAVNPRTARRLRMFATAMMHCLVFQLLLGAMARHFRGSNHPVWAHVGFSVVILILATGVGFAASTLKGPGGLASLRRWGLWLAPVAAVQFLIGWAAFFARGPKIEAGTPAEALIRTAHQANGAILLAVATGTFIWARWLARGMRSVQVGSTGREAAKSTGSAQATPVSV
jgi:cytochrome c oxidase assembly protein subunit 15